MTRYLPFCKKTNNCDCRKSVIEMFLSHQFIQGSQDTNIRTLLLQEQSKRPYGEIVDIALSIESAKLESFIKKTKFFKLLSRTVNTSLL